MMRRFLAALVLILLSVAAHAQCGGPGGGPGNQGVMGCPPASNFLTTDYLLGQQAYNGTTITNFPGKTVKVQPLQLAALIGGGGAAPSQFNATFPAGGVAAGIQQGANMVGMNGDGFGNLQVNLNGSLSNGLDAVAITATNTATESFLYAYNGTAWDRLRVDAFKNLQVNCSVGCVGGIASNGTDAVTPASTNGLTVGFLYGFNGASWDRLRVDAAKNLDVNCLVGCSGGSFVNSTDAVATSTGNAQTVAWLYAFNGATFDRLRDDASKNLMINCAVGCIGGSLSNGTDAVAVTATNTGTTAFNYAFNGTTFDRLRDDASFNLMVNVNVPVALSQTTPGTTNAVSLGYVGSTAIASGAGVVGAGSQRVAVAQDTTTLAGSPQSFHVLVTPDANSPINQTMLNNAPIATGVGGASALGSQRMTVGQDRTTIAGSPPGAAGSPSPSVLSVQGVRLGVPMAVIDTGAATNSTDNMPLTAQNVATLAFGYAFDTTTLTWDRLRNDSSKNLMVNCAAGCAGGTFNNNADALATSATNAQTAAFLYAFNGTTFDRLRDDGSFNLKVNCSVGCSGGSTSNATSAVATSSTNGAQVTFGYAFNGTTWDQLQDDGSKNLKVNCAVGCSGGSTSNATSAVATSSTNGAQVAFGYAFNGTTWDQLQDDASKNLKVLVNAALPAGANQIGTIGLVAGVATVGKIDVLGNAGAILDFAGQNAAAPANAMLSGCTFFTTPTTITTGNASPVECDSAGNQLVNLKTAIPAGANQIGTVGLVAGVAQIGTIGLVAGSATVGKVDLLGNAGSVLDFAGQAATAPANALLTGCTFFTAPTTLTNGTASPMECDTNGNHLVNLKTALPVGSNVIGKTTTDQTTPGTTDLVHSIAMPTASATGAITSVVSAAAESSHVLKASAGNLYSVYAQNLTTTGGFLLVLNATSAPVDGAVTPIECVILPPNGVANSSFNPGPPEVYSTGITAVVTSATTCFTKTTGVITAFIHGAIQ